MNFITYPRPKTRLSKNDALAHKESEYYKSSVIHPADKGCFTVVMGISDYKNEANPSWTTQLHTSWLCVTLFQGLLITSTLSTFA